MNTTTGSRAVHGPNPGSPGPNRKLPIGIQTFREIREGGYYYVDKTGYVQRLVDGGKYYFLSRPRRFGKSLLLDTIGELFGGSAELFRGLAAEGHSALSAARPVVRLDFSRGDFTKPGELRSNVMEQLAAIERREGLTTEYATASGRFAHLVEMLRERTGRRVVVLVDEYDKPVLDALEKPDVARANRDYLRGLYGTIKFCDADIRFALLTGVSKFSMASLFSGLNNLIDITLDPRYSAICGYTETDLDAVFAPELAGLDRDEMRAWYDGYSWRGDERVYNPFSVLLLFDAREFGAYWFETGSPAFLVDTLVKRGAGSLALDNLFADDALLSAFDVDRIAPEALLFQTGYLTIRDQEVLGGTAYYGLGYPNREVRQGLNASLLDHLTGDPARREEHGNRLYDALLADDFVGLETLFRAVFAGIPYQWRTRNDIADYEGYYASVFYSCFAALGLDMRVEDSSRRGRVDMAVLFNGTVYLFEFKVVDSAATGVALAQLKTKGYADKYRGRGQPVHLVGVEFSKETRNIVAFEAERA